MQDTPHFDRWQWDGRRARSHAVSIESEISFDDYQRMSTITHALRNKKFVPPWSLSDVLTRAVILEKLFRYARGPEARKALESGDFRKLEKCAAAARARRAAGQLAGGSEFQRRLVESHLRATEKSIAGLWVRVLYLAYRTRLTSPQIAAEVGISPSSARVILQGLNRVARKLFAEENCNPRQHDPYRKHRMLKAEAEAKQAERWPSTKQKRSNKMKPATIRKHTQRLRKVARKHGGVLPTYTWLNKHGYFGAYESARKSGTLKSFRRAHR